MTKERRKYTRPILKRFGSIRNLTGGSNTVGRDGGATFGRNVGGGG